MSSIENLNYTLSESDGVCTFKNDNTTLGFVRYNKDSEIEYIFVNPIYRNKGLAKRLLKLVHEKTGKKVILQKPISPLGHKLMKSLEKID